MNIEPPPLSRTVITADDARVAAQLSCLYAQGNTYTAVLEAPRLTRPDWQAEVIRQKNAVARARADFIVFAGLSDEAAGTLKPYFSAGQIARVSTLNDVQQLRARQPASTCTPLTWGRDRVGIRLLKAMRLRTTLGFTESPSPIEHVPSKSGHLVVCEEGDDLAQIIAANYAFALRAGLHLIPEVESAVSGEILENFYSLYDAQRGSQSETLERLKTELRRLCGPLPLPPLGSVTFVTGRLPYGFAFPEAPSTHLFKYPGLGISVVNGFAAERPKSRGCGVAVLVDPETTPAPDVEVAERLLPARGCFVRGYIGRGATVRAVSEMVELFPYDLLIIATHCGDTPGYRWTYEFKDSEGIDRRLVVDIAIGIANTDDPEMYNVTQFLRFVSLDGVDWYDPAKSEKLYVGTALTDFLDRTRGDDLKPVEKANIPRAVGAAALKMSDHNLLVIPRSIADEGTPIIINNACTSWHRLAETFTFSNARAYVGTLFMISTTEAQEITIKLLGKYFGKPLPLALWSAQRAIYGDNVRRPYVVTGVYPQRLRVHRQDLPAYIGRRLRHALRGWRASLLHSGSDNDKQKAMLKDRVAFYEREIGAFQSRWL